MNRILSLLCLLCLLGCNSQQNKSVALGPLSQMSEFEVVIYTPSDRDIDRIVESLKKIGEVSISDCSFTSTSASPSIFIFVDAFSNDIRGSLKVFSEIAIQPSQYKTSSCIWAKDYKPEPTCYPVDTENGVMFQKVEKPKEEINEQRLIDSLVAEFMGQYKHDNPDLANPKFKCVRAFPF